MGRTRQKHGEKKCEVINERVNNGQEPNTRQEAPYTMTGPSVYSHAPSPMFRDDGDTHPMDFLEAMDFMFARFNIPSQYRVKAVIDNMEGAPRKWGKAFEKKWTRYDQFVASFQNTYWSAQRQAKVKSELANDSYNKLRDGSMTDFLISWMLKVKHLCPPMTECEFVNAMAQAYPATVENLIIAANIETEEVLLQLLTKLDISYTRRFERHPPNFGKPGESFHKPAKSGENWRHQNRDNRPRINLIETAMSDDQHQQQEWHQQQDTQRQQQQDQQRQHQPQQHDQQRQHQPQQRQQQLNQQQHQPQQCQQQQNQQQHQPQQRQQQLHQPCHNLSERRQEFSENY